MGPQNNKTPPLEGKRQVAQQEVGGCKYACSRCAKLRKRGWGEESRRGYSSEPGLGQKGQQLARFSSYGLEVVLFLSFFHVCNRPLLLYLLPSLSSSRQPDIMSLAAVRCCLFFCATVVVGFDLVVAVRIIWTIVVVGFALGVLVVFTFLRLL